MNIGLSHLATQQDYLLFVASLLWLAAGALWWRAARHRPEWDWLPWSAGAGLLAAWLEIYQFTVPVVAAMGVAPYAETARIGSAITAAMLAGWLLGGQGWPQVRKSLRLLAGGTLLAVAGARWLLPATFPGQLWLVLAATACLLARPGLARGACVVALWLGANGPVADLVGQSRAWTNLSVWGLLWSTTQILAAAVAVRRLANEPASNSEAETERGSWRALLVACGVWLIVGFLLAAWAGRRARLGFETSALSRVRTAAALMDRTSTAAVLEDAFQVRETFEFKLPSGRTIVNGKVPALDTRAGRDLRAELGRIEQANPDIPYVHITTLQGGWVVEATSDRHRRRWAEGVNLPRRATDTDRQRWLAAAAGFNAAFTHTGILETTAEAPLANDSGRLLGWLTFRVPAASWLASQAQARSLVFVAVTLGICLAVLTSLQRRRTRQREAALAAAEAAATADRLKTAFLAKVSHELRTPIQSILGYSELLRPTVADPAARRRLAALRQHGELMLRLVNDLLDLSAIQAGAFRLNPKPTAIGELVRQTAESLQPRAEAKNLRLSCQIAAEVPIWAEVDAERVRQIVLNLVGNAIKFTDHGSIELSFSVVDSTDSLQLVVADSGPGIAPSDRGRLFQPFHRLEATAAKEGTGLGLSLTAALCRSMHGSITVGEAPAGGALFAATFRAPPCWPAVRNAAAHGQSLAALRILIVEDNTLVRELFHAFVQQEGAFCVAVADGETALSEIARASFDTVVLDLGLPRLDGFQVATQLRAQGRTGLRIVGVSAHAGEAEKRKALHAGMDAFLTKPVELAALAAALVPLQKIEQPGIRPEIVARLVARFRTEAAAQSSALDAAISAGDLAATGAAAHYLKNSAAIVRDDRLFAACQSIEAAVAAADRTLLAAGWVQCQAALVTWLGSPFPVGGPPPDSSPNPPTSLNHA